MIDIISLISQYPKSSIIIISCLITFLITLVNYFMLDKDRMREIKKRQKEIQEEAKRHTKEGNHAKAMELQKELFSSTGEMMKHSFKPMLITLIPILIIFAFIRGIYSETTLASSWIWRYFISAIISSIIFRKLFNLP